MTRKTSHFCKCASGTMNVRGREEGGGGGGEREGGDTLPGRTSNPCSSHTHGKTYC